MTAWQRNFKMWQDYADQVRAHAEAIDRMRSERAWKLAASVGIGQCMCSLHNAAIDDDMTGWCHNNPRRLKVAKQANHILNDWRASRLADRIVQRAFDRMVRP